MRPEQQFDEWYESFEVTRGHDVFDLIAAAFFAGYKVRSSEVAEDLRLFHGLMDGIRVDPDE